MGGSRGTDMHCVNAALLQEIRQVVGSHSDPQTARQRICSSRVGIDDCHELRIEAACCAAVPVAHQPGADDCYSQSARIPRCNSKAHAEPGAMWQSSGPSAAFASSDLSVQGSFVLVHRAPADRVPREPFEGVPPVLAGIDDPNTQYPIKCFIREWECHG